MKKLLVVIGLIWPLLISAQINKAFEKGNYLKVKELITSSPAIIKAIDKEGNTPLHIAARYGHYDICKLLIDNGADINAGNLKKTTPLSNAINYEYIEVAELLINSGVDIKSENNNANMALISAVYHDLYDIAELLINQGADINTASYLQWNNKAIHICNNVSIANLLISNGADVNSRNKYGRTPLHNLSGAYSSEQYKLIKYLVNQGANINVRDNSGFTPLDLANYPVNNTYTFRNLGGLYGSELDTLLKNFTTRFYLLQKYESTANDVKEIIGPPHIVVEVEILGMEIWKYWYKNDVYELYFSSAVDKPNVIDLSKPAEKIKHEASNKGELTAMYKNKQAIEFTPPVKLSDIEGKVTSLLFFESGYNILPKNQRVYSNKFKEDETRYINWELNVEHLDPGSKIDFVLTYNYYKPDGTELCKSKKISYIDKGWTDSWRTGGWGNINPGVVYKKGVYNVKIFMANEEIASGKFEIY